MTDIPCQIDATPQRSAQVISHAQQSIIERRLIDRIGPKIGRRVVFTAVVVFACPDRWTDCQVQLNIST